MCVIFLIGAGLSYSTAIPILNFIDSVFKCFVLLVFLFMIATHVQLNRKWDIQVWLHGKSDEYYQNK